MNAESVVMNGNGLVLVEPREVQAKLGRLVRLLRHREGLTQSELASRSGVPAATISAFERTGKAGSEILLRLWFALGTLDSFNDYLDGRLRMAKFPRNLAESGNTVVFRVRHKREAQ